MLDRDDVSRKVMLEVISKVPEITVDSNAPIETIRDAYQRAHIILGNKKEQIEPRAGVIDEGAQNCSKENGENEQRKPSLDVIIGSAGNRCEKRLEKGRDSNIKFTEQERE